MTPTVLAAEGNAAVTMSTEIKTAITTACQSAVDAVSYTHLRAHET